MRLIAVHLPEKLVDDIQRLVDNGLYPNRSETIRIAIRDLLKRELWVHSNEMREQPIEASRNEILGR